MKRAVGILVLAVGLASSWGTTFILHNNGSSAITSGGHYRNSASPAESGSSWGSIAGPIAVGETGSATYSILNSNWFYRAYYQTSGGGTVFMVQTPEVQLPYGDTSTVHWYAVYEAPTTNWCYSATLRNGDSFPARMEVYCNGSKVDEFIMAPLSSVPYEYCAAAGVPPCNLTFRMCPIIANEVMPDCISMNVSSNATGWTPEGESPDPDMVGTNLFQPEIGLGTNNDSFASSTLTNLYREDTGRFIGNQLHNDVQQGLRSVAGGVYEVNATAAGGFATLGSKLDTVNSSVGSVNTSVGQVKTAVENLGSNLSGQSNLLHLISAGQGTWGIASSNQGVALYELIGKIKNTNDLFWQIGQDMKVMTVSLTNHTGELTNKMDVLIAKTAAGTNKLFEISGLSSGVITQLSRIYDKASAIDSSINNQLNLANSELGAISNVLSGIYNRSDRINSMSDSAWPMATNLLGQIARNTNNGLDITGLTQYLNTTIIATNSWQAVTQFVGSRIGTGYHHAVSMAIRSDLTQAVESVKTELGAVGTGLNAVEVPDDGEEFSFSLPIAGALTFDVDSSTLPSHGVFAVCRNVIKLCLYLWLLHQLCQMIVENIDKILSQRQIEGAKQSIAGFNASSLVAVIYGLFFAGVLYIAATFTRDTLAPILSEVSTFKTAFADAATSYPNFWNMATYIFPVGTAITVFVTYMVNKYVINYPLNFVLRTYVLAFAA